MIYHLSEAESFEKINNKDLSSKNDNGDNNNIVGESKLKSKLKSKLNRSENNG